MVALPTQSLDPGRAAPRLSLRTRAPAPSPPLVALGRIKRDLRAPAAAPRAGPSKNPHQKWPLSCVNPRGGPSPRPFPSTPGIYRYRNWRRAAAPLGAAPTSPGVVASPEPCTARRLYARPRRSSAPRARVGAGERARAVRPAPCSARAWLAWPSPSLPPPPAPRPQAPSPLEKGAKLGPWGVACTCPQGRQGRGCAAHLGYMCVYARDPLRATKETGALQAPRGAAAPPEYQGLLRPPSRAAGGYCGPPLWGRRLACLVRSPARFGRAPSPKAPRCRGASQAPGRWCAMLGKRTCEGLGREELVAAPS
ncbi:MAG: hypothetical protein J3K34DRAFT_431291 [Monoraphidium minutum]|nr:MAG: hypothetical protein J3K34DRAFT_431291 [Monoraphidium minutum]